MKRAQRVGLLIILNVLVGLSVAGACFGQAPGSTETFRTSTSHDRQGLSVTVYTSGAAVVRDTRRVEMPQGSLDLKFSDVARQLVPDSVQFASVTAPDSLNVLGQTYSYDLLNPERLLQAYVGKTLTVVLVRRQNGSDVEVPVEAELLAANPGPVWRIGGKIETGLEADHYVFPSVPPNFSATPALMFRLNNERASEQSVRVSYFTNGLTWATNYVLNVGRDWTTASLAARATVNNHSGADYDHAELQLIAGELRRINVIGVRPGPMMGVAGALAQTAAPAPSPGQAFAGYHLYTFSRPVDLLDNSTRQVSLVEPSRVRISRSYEVIGQAYYNPSEPEPESFLSVPVSLRVRFDNTTANSLGEPLPGGVVRVYKADDAGREQLVGEDQLRSTAPDESVTLDLGNAFDVVEKGKQTDYKRVGPNSAEAAYEITLNNHQAQPITVIVNEPFNGDWQILSSSVPYEKTSSTTARFNVPVPANGTTFLKYQVRIQWVR